MQKQEREGIVYSMATNKPSRVLVSPIQLVIYDWAAYAAFSKTNDLEEMMEDTDLQLYTYDGEYYTESHDEQTVHVFRDGKLVELDWNDRPR